MSAGNSATFVILRMYTTQVYIFSVCKYHVVNNMDFNLF
jgi:hypothetical protein